MDSYASSIANGLWSRMQALDVVANNLANAATTGYKADHSFQMTLSEAESNGMAMPRFWTDSSQGTLKSTGTQTDLAINGTGYFTVSGGSGPLYTRNGAFQVAPTGELVTSEGYKLQASGGSAIRIDPNRPFVISPDGSVTQDGASAGQVAVVEFPTSSSLIKHGGSYYKPVNTGEQPKPSSALVVQGSLETSNVSPAESSVEMIGIMRQFESLQRALSLHSEMDKRTTESSSRTTAG